MGKEGNAAERPVDRNPNYRRERGHLPDGGTINKSHIHTASYYSAPVSKSVIGETTWFVQVDVN